MVSVLSVLSVHVSAEDIMSTEMSMLYLQFINRKGCRTRKPDTRECQHMPMHLTPVRQVHTYVQHT